MARRRKPPVEELVAHPRYGDEPMTSGLSIKEAKIRAGYWRYDSETLFPQSVLIADPARQNYSIYPRAYYVDVLRQCLMCKRRFIFFAREQRHWYETLHFYVDADCVHCPDCRRAQRTTQRRLRRYSDTVHHVDLDAAQLRMLVDDALHLFEHGVLRDLNTLGRLKNRALRELPDYAGTHALIERLAAAHQATEA